MAKKESTTVKELAMRIGKAKGLEADEAAKMLRRRIRANFDLIQANWPAMKAQGKENRDGNRYPPMPPALADALFVATTKGTPMKEALAKPRKARKPKAAPTTTPAPEGDAA